MRAFAEKMLQLQPELLDFLQRYLLGAGAKNTLDFFDGFSGTGRQFVFISGRRDIFGRPPAIAIVAAIVCIPTDDVL